MFRKHRALWKNRSAFANCFGILKSKSIQTLLCELPLLQIELIFHYIWKNAIELPSGPHGKSEPTGMLIVTPFSDARKEERVLEAAVP